MHGTVSHGTTTKAANISTPAARLRVLFFITMSGYSLTRHVDVDLSSQKT